VSVHNEALATFAFKNIRRKVRLN
jgi:hypothetical protein